MYAWFIISPRDKKTAVRAAVLVELLYIRMPDLRAGDESKTAAGAAVLLDQDGPPI
jgi:hypothetical protein